MIVRLALAYAAVALAAAAPGLILFAVVCAQTWRDQNTDREDA
jgi:hypothetical protein